MNKIQWNFNQNACTISLLTTIYRWVSARKSALAMELHLSCTNLSISRGHCTMVADDLVTKRARTSAAMVLTYCLQCIKEVNSSFSFLVLQEAQGAIQETRCLRSKVHLAEQAQNAARGMEHDYAEVIRLLEDEIVQLKGAPNKRMVRWIGILSGWLSTSENCSSLAMELLQSGTKPLKYSTLCVLIFFFRKHKW